MRGKHYSARRAWLENVLGRAYSGDWPARVWALVPGATRVVGVRHRFALLPGPYSKRYPYGAHGIGAMQLVVSRGVGTTELPIRMFAPADVLLVELVCPT